MDQARAVRIFARGVDPADVALGDVITIKVHQADIVLLTHRVSGITGASTPSGSWSSR